jgi:hypothetical protein
MKYSKLVFGLLLMLTVFASCSKIEFADIDGPGLSTEDSIKQVAIDNDLIDSYILSKSLQDVRTNSLGARYAVIQEGNGIFASLNDIVSVNFVTKFLNDSIIDSNVESIANSVPTVKDNFTYIPLVFNYTVSGGGINFIGQYGYLGLMPGMRVSIANALSIMDEGSKALIILPSTQAIGATGYRLTSGFNIEPNTVLVFEIELKRIRKSN